MTEQEAYSEVYCYTMTHSAPTFILQHVVDAYAAQRASATTKPIALAMALVGLYLHVERQRTGREVQRVHMLLARRKPAWPAFPLPASRGSITAELVLAAPAGSERDAAIEAWCAAVWAAYRDARPAVLALLAEQGIG